MGFRDAALFFFKIGILFRAAGAKENLFSGVDFVYEHKEEARAPRKNTGHLNPSPRQSYFPCWQRSNALNEADAGRLW
jgi:hypothetical protein